MIPLADLEAGAWAVLSWLFTYAVHSTLLLGAALAAARFTDDHGWRDLLWKAALVGGLLTASLQLGLGFTPLAGRWDLPVSTVKHEAPAVTAAERKTQHAGIGASSDKDLSWLSQHDLTWRGAEPLAQAEPGVEWMLAASQGWPTALLTAWLTVAAIGLSRIVFAHVRLRRTLAGRVPVGDEGLSRALEEFRREAGARGPIRLTVAPACPVPIAIRGREVVVPPRFLDELDGEQQRAGLAHEVAHVLRRDPEWLTFALALERLFFFQPLQRLARRRLRESAEYLCDEWSVRQTGSPLALARCLEAVASWLAASKEGVPEMASPMARGDSPFVRRVERMLAGIGPMRRPSRLWLAVALIAVLAVAPLVSGTGPRDRTFLSSSISGLTPEELARARAELRIHRPSQPSQPLSSRWQWALDEARSRGLRDFWIVYTFYTPTHAKEMMVSESGGNSFVGTLDESTRKGASMTALLEDAAPLAGNGNVAVLVHYGAARRDAFDSAEYRSLALGRAFGRTPVFWLGYAEETQSLGQMETLYDEAAGDELRTLLIEAASLHPTTDLVLPFLQRLLEPGNTVAVRSEAAEGFNHHHDPRSVRILLAAARQDPSSEVRAEAAETIGEVQVPEAIPALLDLAKSSQDLEVRCEAAEGFADQPPARAVPAIEELLASNLHEEVLEEAVETLGEMPGREPVGLLLRVAWEHPSPVARQEAVETLGDTHEEGAVAALTRIAWEHRDRNVGLEAVETLGEADGEGAVDALVRILWEHPDRDLQREAVETLSERSGDDAIPELKRVLREHPDAEVRSEARDALGDHGGE